MTHPGISCVMVADGMETLVTVVTMVSFYNNQSIKKYSLKVCLMFVVEFPNEEGSSVWIDTQYGKYI